MEINKQKGKCMYMYNAKLVDQIDVWGGDGEEGGEPPRTVVEGGGVGR